ncbi:MAG: HAMP domain-containing histidine kinase, partial [Clostridiales bacterium]|nr:HAMP domain-containing histidine kinase [Clostridiales bacterium]
AEVRLEELIAQTVLTYEEKIEQKGLQLECDLNEVRMKTYPAYLEIVCGNLISNAVKFTEAGGTVGVTLKRKANGKATIAVSDTGCGISAEAGAHIFDKFYQADTSHAGEGNGLGLALVKRVIDTIGGEIAVESAPGKGSTFTVTVSEAEA